jgi:hypothetical protein
MSILSAGTSNTTSLIYTGDTTGAMVFQTNGTTEAMRITAAQNVGIGTSSPGSGIRLDVLGGEIRAGRVDASSEGGQVSFSRSTDNATAWYIDVFGNTSTPSLRFVDVSVGVVRATIDGSGRVTMPYQPYFAAHVTVGSGAAYTSVSGGTPFPANSTAFNVGSHYNTSTYRFTAPIAGNYLFTWSGINGSQSSGSRPTFFVNGSSNYINGLQFGISGGDSGSPQNCTSAVIKLNAGDYVDMRSSAGSLYFYNASHSCFTGILLS